MDHTPSAYEILGLRDGASPKEVRAAYYKLIKELHPDGDGAKYPNRYQGAFGPTVGNSLERKTPIIGTHSGLRSGTTRVLFSSVT